MKYLKVIFAVLFLCVDITFVNAQKLQSIVGHWEATRFDMMVDDMPISIDLRTGIASGISEGITISVPCEKLGFCDVRASYSFFADNTYSDYANFREITQEHGDYILRSNTILCYINGELDEILKIISLTDMELILQNESEDGTITMYFDRK